MKGLFLPEITTEDFRDGCLESIEALIGEGEIYDIDYPEPCEDCISREKMLEIVNTKTGYVCPVDVLSIPAAQPKVKTGRWILVDEESNTWKCTNCIKEGKDDWWQLNHGTPQDNKMDYCPHCGAKMLPADSDKE